MLGALTLRARSLAASMLVLIGSGAGVLPIHAGEVRYYETSAVPTQSTAMQKTILDTPTGPRELYIATTPTLRLGEDGLRAVLVEKGPVIRDVVDAEAFLALRRVRPEQPTPCYFITFFMKRKAANMLNDFGNRNTGKLVDIRVDDRRLVTPKFVGKFVGGDSNVVPLGDMTSRQVEEVLEPLKHIVIWK